MYKTGYCVEDGTEKSPKKPAALSLEFWPHGPLLQVALGG